MSFTQKSNLNKHKNNFHRNCQSSNVSSDSLLQAFEDEDQDVIIKRQKTCEEKDGLPDVSQATIDIAFTNEDKEANQENK